MEAFLHSYHQSQSSRAADRSRAQNAISRIHGLMKQDRQMQEMQKMTRRFVAAILASAVAEFIREQYDHEQMQKQCRKHQVNAENVQKL